MPEEIYVPKRRSLRVVVVACCVVSLGIQYFLVKFGFFAVSADESARALIAWDLSWDTIFVPFI